ncbi:hypothetical protein [Piscirickettsia salmonis]|uniref:hypothetical protein n=1 Tax=Piscirickettsia salmonis TaxID=1238 RepID=UPI0012BAE47E|nr:hypothetical protein [Piscirickettsia salmonis]QGP58180.1 hypothetical protein PsalBI1_00734 [Piscirickettsia salmonis]
MPSPYSYDLRVRALKMNKFAQNSIYLSSQQATRYFGKLPLRVVMRFVFFRSKLRGIRPLAIDTIALGQQFLT